MASRRKNIKQVLDAYQPNLDESVPRRVVALLVYGAQELPFKPIPVPWITKVVYKEKKLPTEDSKLVESMKGRTTRIRDLLRSEYRKGLVSLPGQGWRATVNEDDYTATQADRSGQRAAQALRSSMKDVDAIDARAVKKPENRSRLRELSKAEKLIGENKLVRLLEGQKEESQEE
jgi:hypothetical protein